MHNFLPHTPADRQAMLDTIGVPSVDALFDDIPAQLRENISYQVLPARGLSEAELQQELAQHAADNHGQQMVSFLGGGAYSRFIPMAVNTIAGRAEFYTAYTPYQPEIAQGTLQVTYEFQTMICELTGMDVANASVYDGANALTEAAFMAMRATKRQRILVARSVHPDYRQVLATYVDGLGDVSITEFDPRQGEQALAAVEDPAGVACVIVQVPDYFGGLNDPAPLRAFCERTGALFIVSADPVSLGLLEAPGRYGADIVTGDIQPLGNNLSFGGPYGGYVATRAKYLRQLPGRLVGRSVDKTGRPCYTLTLQTREQHIRREKATSNICTNQALNVLKATVYMTLLGPAGLRHVANLSAQRAHALAQSLAGIPGVRRLFTDQPFLFEFALQLPGPVQPLLTHLEKQGILGGIALERFYPEYPNSLLVACTETTTPAHLERLTEAMRVFFESRPLTSGSRRAEDKLEATC